MFPTGTMSIFYMLDFYFEIVFSYLYNQVLQFYKLKPLVLVFFFSLKSAPQKEQETKLECSLFHFQSLLFIYIHFRNEQKTHTKQFIRHDKLYTYFFAKNLQKDQMKKKNANTVFNVKWSSCKIIYMS